MLFLLHGNLSVPSSHSIIIFTKQYITSYNRSRIWQPCKASIMSFHIEGPKMAIASARGWCSRKSTGKRTDNPKWQCKTIEHKTIEWCCALHYLHKSIPQVIGWHLHVSGISEPNDLEVQFFVLHSPAAHTYRPHQSNCMPNTYASFNWNSTRQAKKDKLRP